MNLHINSYDTRNRSDLSQKLHQLFECQLYNSYQAMISEILGLKFNRDLPGHLVSKLQHHLWLRDTLFLLK